MPYPHVCHISMLWTLVDLFLMKRLFSQETVFFSHIILPEIKMSSFTIEFRCFCKINKFGTGTLCRIFKYSTEHLKVPGNLDSYLLTIKKKSVIFSGSKQMQQRNTIIIPRKYVNIYKNT